MIYSINILYKGESQMKLTVLPLLLLIFLLPSANPQSQDIIKNGRSHVYAQVEPDTVFYFANRSGDRLYLQMPLAEAAKIMGVDNLKQYKLKETEWSVIYAYGPFEFITVPQDEYVKDKAVGIRFVKNDPAWKLVPAVADLEMTKEVITVNLGHTSDNFPQEPDEWTYLFNSNTNLTLVFANNKVSQIDLWMGM
jgi:hypothetical protein